MVEIKEKFGFFYYSFVLINVYYLNIVVSIYKNGRIVKR